MNSQQVKVIQCLSVFVVFVVHCKFVVQLDSSGTTNLQWTTKTTKT